MNYVYTNIENKAWIDEIISPQSNYIKRFDCSDFKIHLDIESYKINWTQRALFKLLVDARMGDNLVAFDGDSLAISTSQICEIFILAAKKKVNIHFVKYDLSLNAKEDKIDTCHLINLISLIESDFVSKRTIFSLARRRAAGLPLGRPKGVPNKSLKLDKHKEEIEKYLKLGISGASIAKLIGCHAQTFYDYLERSKMRKAS